MSNRNKNFLFLSALLIIATLACGLENIQVVESPNLEATITAQALLIQQGSPASQNEVVVVVTATLDPSASTTEEAVVPASVVQVTAPVGAVTVTVSTATNCRTGPGQNFSIVYGMPVGQIAEVVAKNTYSGYWIIKIPNGNGTCWLWGQYATVTGNTASLSEVVTPTSSAPTKTNTPKPTLTLIPTATNTTAPVVNKPNAPSGLSGTVTCTASVFPNQLDYAVSITWIDNSNNEDTFNIFTNSALVPVNANTTSYNFTQTYTAGTTLTVSVTAQNSAGSSAPTTTSFICA